MDPGFEYREECTGCMSKHAKKTFSAARHTNFSSPQLHLGTLDMIWNDTYQKALGG